MNFDPRAAVKSSKDNPSGPKYIPVKKNNQRHHLPHGLAAPNPNQPLAVSNYYDRSVDHTNTSYTKNSSFPEIIESDLSQLNVTGNNGNNLNASGLNTKEWVHHYMSNPKKMQPQNRVLYNKLMEKTLLKNQNGNWDSQCSKNNLRENLSSMENEKNESENRLASLKTYEQKPITQGKQVSQLPRNAIRANTRNLTNHENSISSVSQHHSTIELHPNDPKSQNPQRKPGPLLLNQKASRENSNPFDPLRLRGHKKSNSSSNADYLKAFDAEKHGNHLDLMRLQKNQFQTEIDPHSNGKSTSGVGFLKENQVGESWNPKKEISAIAERGESQFSEIFSRTSDAEPKKRNKNEGPAAPITTSQNNNKSVFAGIMRRKKSGLQIQRGALSLDDNSIKELEATLNKLKFVSKFSGKEILKDPTIPGIVMSFSKQLRAATGKVVWPQSAKETVGVLQQIVENMADALRSKTQKNSENPSSFCSSIQSSKSRNKRKISHQVKEEIGMSSVPEGRGKPECKEISSESLMSFKNKKFITIPSVDSRSGSANNKETPAFSKTGNKTSKKNVKKTYVMESSEDESRSNNVTDEHIVVPFDFSQKTQELIKEERKKKKGEKKTEEKPVYHLDVGRGVYKKKKVGESLKKPNTRAHSEASVKNKKKSRKGEAQEMEGRGSFGKNNAKGKHLSMQHEMGRNGLNDSLKLAIPNNIDRSGFHEEFMSRLDEFSQSWRKAAMKEKRF